MPLMPPAVVLCSGCEPSREKPSSCSGVARDSRMVRFLRALDSVWLVATTSSITSYGKGDQASSNQSDKRQ